MIKQIIPLFGGIVCFPTMFNIFLRCLSNDSNGGRSREQTEHIGAEADNEVVSIGRIGKVNLFALTIRTRLIIAQQFAYAHIAQISLPRRNKLNEAPIHEKQKERDCVPCFVVDRGLATALAYARYA